MTSSRLAVVLCALLLGAAVTGCDDPEASPPVAVGGTPAAEPAGDDTSEAAAELPRLCDLLTAEQIGEALGAPVTVEVGPLGECEFGQDDPREIGGSLGVVEVQAGGYDSYRTGTAASLGDPVEHTLDGLGSAAFATTGTVAGGENLQAQGGAQVADTVVYSVTLTQGSGHTEDELVDVVRRLLGLMVDAG